MRNIIKGITILTIITIVLGVGLSTNNTDNEEINQVIKESNNNYYVEEGEQIIQFTDGSYIICDLQGNILD